MGKSSPKPPPPPDYAAAAKEQGQANLEAARITARLLNPNISTPLGGQRVSWGRTQTNQQAYDVAMKQYEQALQQYEQGQQPGVPGYGDVGGMPQKGGMPQGGMAQPGVPDYSGIRDQMEFALGGTTFKPGEQGFTFQGPGGGIGAFGLQYDESGRPIAPDISQFQYMTDLDTPFIEQYLTPEAQATLEAQQRVERAYAGLGEQAIGQVSDIFSQQFRPDLTPMATQLQGYGEVPTAPDIAAMGRARGEISPEALPTTPDIAAMGRAGANVSAQGVNYGPQVGQFGMAGGGPTGLNLVSPELRGGQGIQGGPVAGQFGMASGGPTSGQFGMAGGGPAAPGQIAGADVSGVGRVSYGPQEGQYGVARGVAPGQRLQQGVDTQGLTALPTGAGMTAQEAILSRLTPTLTREQAALEQQLANQGLVRGGEAYNAAMEQQYQRANDLITQAALQGISVDAAMRQQGFSERQIQAELANQARMGQFGMGVQQAQLGNQAIAQNQAQALAVQQAQNQAQAQDLQQRLAMGQFGREGQQIAFQMGQAASQAQNQAIAQNFAQAQAAQQAQNQAISQNFAQAQAAQQAANAAQAQGFQQRLGEAQFGREGQLASFQTQQQAQQAYNQAVQQNFAQGMSAAEAENRAAQQVFGQQVAAQELQNQALAQNQAAALQQFQTQMARQQQGFGQQMDMAGLYNAALAQQQQTALQQAQAQAALQNQAFGQAQTAAQFENQVRQQQLAEQMALRAQPLNEIAALMGGSQIQMPQFQGYQGATVAPAPIFGASQAAGNFAQQNYANQVAGYNAQMGGLYDLAGTIGGAVISSDRRLKSNIVRVGTHPLGIGIYEYDIRGERQRGVMADEVLEVMPEAVLTGDDGYMMVNYGML